MTKKLIAHNIICYILIVLTIFGVCMVPYTPKISFLGIEHELNMDVYTMFNHMLLVCSASIFFYAVSCCILVGDQDENSDSE